jgi:hypothetical protein
MSSTQAKKARNWLTRMNTLKMKGTKGDFTPPMFSQVYNITTQPEDNAKGSWFGWSIDHEGPVASGELYAGAKLFHSTVQQGNVKIATPSTDEEDVPF